ncbi:hypothetical protein L284_04080 [Novosphingobium lindaniclasticum LE124]|uniref:Uncharacterized protein n=1 Tax=Novosphingobium lindaniclasticum LE124 TaxID=1096930 RepID=T0HQI1_9SPHN|nr:hypothetical protein L284_04080 [Novosphingobium lindaniclasticum LE124]
MLDHVERGRVPEQPAGENLAPAKLLGGTAAFLHEGLNEGALLLGLLPGERLLARGDLDDEIADPARLAGLHHQVLRQVVALVEDAQCDHAVLVRRADLLALGRLGGPGLHACDRVRDAGVLHFGRGRALAACSQQRHQDKHRRESDNPAERSPHHRSAPQASGDQAS